MFVCWKICPYWAHFLGYHYYKQIFCRKIISNTSRTYLSLVKRHGNTETNIRCCFWVLNFCCIWPTFNWVITLCKNLVFWTFLSCLLWYWFEIWYMDLSWHNTDQVWLLLHLTYFCMIYCPLLKYRFPHFHVFLQELCLFEICSGR